MNKEFYEHKANLMKVLANTTRLMIIDALANGDKNVGELVALIGDSQSNISKCLAVLKANRFVKDSKKGLNVYYSLSICCMGEFFTSLNNVLKEHAGNQQKILRDGGIDR